jgi:hypothetical protein
VPAAARSRLAGCALLSALLLAGCGSGGPDRTTDAEVTARALTVPQTPRVKPRKKQADGAAGPCQGRLGSFVASMDSLRRRLAVGLTYDQYVAEVRGIRSTYRKVPIERVEFDCLNAVGTPAEKAFNGYIEAANRWGECVSEAGCSSAAVEPVLQRRWRLASGLLSEADEALTASAPAR